MQPLYSLNPYLVMATIQIAEFVSFFPSFRISADKLFEFSNNIEDMNILMDFTDVVGMTHSFASQYLLQKKVSNKHITEENMNKNVVEMFRFSSNPRKQVHVEKISIGKFPDD